MPEGASPARYFVAELVEEVGSLPAVAAQVVSLSSDPDCDIADLARVIISDNVMTMRFLALVNSAAFAGGEEIRDLRRALVMLGLRRVRNVAMCMGMHDMMPAAGSQASAQQVEFWKYTLATASCAESLAWLDGNKSCEDAWLTGILHGIGMPALAQQIGPDMHRARRKASEDGVTLLAAEAALFEFDHAELGSRMLEHWNLPTMFSEAVAFQAEDFTSHEISADAIAQIGYLRPAIAIVRAIGFGHNGDGTPAPDLMELVAELAITDELLQALADKVERDVNSMSQIVGLDIPDDFFHRVLETSRQHLARVGLEGLDDSLAREGLENELEMARVIQRRLLPDKPPALAGGRLAAFNQPSLRVSGDYYDFVTWPDGTLGIVVADVSGKGTSASLLASNVQATLRALLTVFTDPGELLAHVNDALHASTDPERFATLFLGALSPDGRRLRYANAGHNPPLLRRAGGQTEWLTSKGTPLGMVPGMAYPVTELDLTAGDLLVCYTDGVVEATDDDDREYAEEGLEATVGLVCDLSPDEVIAAVIGDIAAHCASLTTHRAAAVPAARLGDLADDLTMVVLKVD